MVCFGVVVVVVGDISVDDFDSQVPERVPWEVGGGG